MTSHMCDRRSFFALVDIRLRPKIAAAAKSAFLAPALEDLREHLDQ
jgi:hypothetical protein